MFITCQECDTIFRLDESLLKPGGSKVRCSQCKNVFTVYPPKPVEIAEREEELFAFDSPRAEGAQALGTLSGLDARLDREISAGVRKPAQSVGNMTVDDSQFVDSDLDLDFDLESEESSSAALASDAMASNKAVMDDELDLDMQFDLDDALLTESTVTGQTEAIQDSDDLDFDFNLDEEGPEPVRDEAEAKKEVESEFAELDLDLDSELSSQAPGVQEPAEPEADVFDSLELDLENADALDDSGQAIVAAPKDKDQTGEDDLDFKFDLEPEQAEASLVSQNVEEPELFLDDDFGEQDAVVPPSAEEELAKELNLMDAGPETAQPDDFDLSELDAVLGLKQQPATQLSGEEKASVDEEEVEDLEFKLDAEYEDKPIFHESQAETKSEKPADEDEEELDLSDLEQMLEKGGVQPEPVEDFLATASLDIGDEQGRNRSEFESELDISDFEEAINSADKMPVEADSNAEAELELDLDLEADRPHDDLLLESDVKGPKPDDAVHKTTIRADDLEIEFELDDTSAYKAPQKELGLSDLSELVESDHVEARSGVQAGGGIDLEFQLEGEKGEPETARSTPSIAPPEQQPESEEILAEGTEAAPIDQPKPQKGPAKILIIIMVLLILAAGGYFGYNYVMSSGIEIPYLNQYLHPQPADPQGILNLSTIDINSKFIEHETEGRLFVISGKVLNRYPTARGMIRLEGKLFAKGKTLAKTENVYAGKTIPDQELAKIAVTEIKQQLASPPNAQDADSKVLPGKSLPFTLVFSDLPENLDEFAIELSGSVQAN